MNLPKEVLEAIEKAKKEGRVVEYGSRENGGYDIQGVIYKESEGDFQKAVIEFAQSRGWKVAHFRKARTKEGWRTPVAADGKGWPDLVLVRERIVFMELKSESGRMSPDQDRWLDWLVDAKAEIYVLRPDDWSLIEEVLE